MASHEVSSHPPEELPGEEGTHLGDTSGTGAGSPAGTNTDADPSDLTPKDKVKVCKFFLMGKCHFGQRCRLSHSDPSGEDPGAASPDPDEASDGEKTEKHKRNKSRGNKANKPEYNEGKVVSKKPRMRTADDVINRILWDASVDSSEFVVGYLDRFLGVMERPFCDFNWDVNPCDCDYAAELALPRHRIQYFTYRGHRVWDRHTRTDRVFGSTGQSLAPPFGKEEEGIQEQQGGASEEQPPVVSGKEGGDAGECVDVQLEEEQQSEMNIHGPDSTAAAAEPACGAVQEQLESLGTRVEEEAEERLKNSTEKTHQETEAEPEWRESWDVDGNPAESFHRLTGLDTNQAPLEQRQEVRGGGGGGRPPKKRPTHFITFRANTPAILSCFQQLQEEVTAALPASAPHWQAAPSLHVTLCLLVLRGPAEVAAAAEVLRRFALLDRNPLVSVTFPVKLKHFAGRVLYLSPHPQLALQQLNAGLQEAYRREGRLHRDSYNPRYHLTLAKVEAWDGERVFEEVGDLRVGKNLNFGRLPINTLHLCSVNGAKVDGFYETVCTVNLR